MFLRPCPESILECFQSVICVMMSIKPFLMLLLTVGRWHNMEMVFLHGLLQGDSSDTSNSRLSSSFVHGVSDLHGVSDSAFGENAASSLVIVTRGLPGKTETKAQMSVLLFIKYSLLQASLEMKRWPRMRCDNLYLSPVQHICCCRRNRTWFLEARGMGRRK